jgi:hypothetical protein
VIGNKITLRSFLSNVTVNNWLIGTVSPLSQFIRRIQARAQFLKLAEQDVRLAVASVRDINHLFPTVDVSIVSPVWWSAI